MSHEKWIRDNLIRYGMLHKKRYTSKEKEGFLKVMESDLKEQGIQVNVTKGSIKAYSDYMLFAGNIKRTKYIIISNFDTPLYSFKKLIRQSTVSSYYDKLRHISFVGIMIIFLVLLYTSVIAYQHLFSNDLLSITLFFIYISILLFIIQKFKYGFTSNENYIYNTSSILVSLCLLKHLNNEVGIILCDHMAGKDPNLMYEKIAPFIHKDQKLIILDHIGSNGILYYQEDHIYKEVDDELSQKHSFILSAGTLHEDELYFNVRGQKDCLLNFKNIDQAIKLLENIVKGDS